MKFMYGCVRLPKDHKLLKDINLAASRLFNKLKHLDVQSLDISDYNKRYLDGYLINARRTLCLYSYILAWSIDNLKVPINEIVFLDYGGGSGILSLLARELGIGSVIYSDIYDVSCRDARIIGESIGGQADYYIEGEIDEVVSFLRKKSISCSAVAAYDVIEHIYDVEGFLKKLPSLSDGPLNIVMTSSANTFNPRIRKSLMKTQLEREYKDCEKKWGHKERDCLKAYFEIRKDIITGYASGLSQEEVKYVAKASRGMIKADIERCMDAYLKTGQFPKEPSHPTNTCDPYTGNWTEHLMDIHRLKYILGETGFKTDILSGVYGCHKNIMKKLFGDFLNVIIYLFRNEGIRIAPFFTLYGRRD